MKQCVNLESSIEFLRLYSSLREISEHSISTLDCRSGTVDTVPCLIQVIIQGSSFAALTGYY